MNRPRFEILCDIRNNRTNIVYQLVYACLKFENLSFLLAVTFTDQI